ncbi:hypothetical protein ACHAWC_006496 [Mediolabrus comicus]
MKLHHLASATAVLLTAFSSGTAAASSLRGRVAVNSDSVDSEDYYYFPEVEDYEFVEGEEPEDLDDEDMELYLRYGRNYYGPGYGQRAAKQAWRDSRYARNRAKKAAQRGYNGYPYYAPRYGYGYGSVARQARRQARAAARYGYGYTPY